MNKVHSIALLFCLWGLLSCAPKKLEPTHKPNSPEAMAPHPEDPPLVSEAQTSGEFKDSHHKGNRLGESEELPPDEHSQPPRLTDLHVQSELAETLDPSSIRPLDGRLLSLRLSVALRPNNEQIKNIKHQIMKNLGPEEINLPGDNMCDPYEFEGQNLEFKALALVLFKEKKYLLSFSTSLSSLDYLNTEFVEFNLGKAFILAELELDQSPSDIDIDQTSATPLWMKSFSRWTARLMNELLEDLDQNVTLEVTCTKNCTDIVLLYQDQMNKVQPIKVYEFSRLTPLRYQWDPLRFKSGSYDSVSSYGLPRVNSHCRDLSEPFVQLDGLGEYVSYGWDQIFEDYQPLKKERKLNPLAARKKRRDGRKKKSSNYNSESTHSNLKTRKPNPGAIRRCLRENPGYRELCFKYKNDQKGKKKRLPLSERKKRRDKRRTSP